MNKAVFVQAIFKPIARRVIKEVSTGEKKTGILGGEKDVKKKVTAIEPTGSYSNCMIDGQRLTYDINKAISDLNNEGYEVISITPITSGNYDYERNNGVYWGYGYGYGYSYTEGVTIIGKKIT